MKLTNLILVGLAALLPATKGASGGTAYPSFRRGYLAIPPNAEMAEMAMKHNRAHGFSPVIAALQDAIVAQRGRVVRRGVQEPEPPADETTWLLSMCKGFKLVDAMRGTDEEAGKLYVPERPVAQSRITDPDSKCDCTFPLALSL